MHINPPLQRTLYFLTLPLYRFQFEQHPRLLTILVGPLRAIPTPPGVPVKTISPGSSVICWIEIRY